MEKIAKGKTTALNYAHYASVTRAICWKNVVSVENVYILSHIDISNAQQRCLWRQK